MIRNQWLGRYVLYTGVLLLAPTVFHTNSLHAQADEPAVSNAAATVRPVSHAPAEFLVAPHFSLSYSPTSVAVGDLNGDGRPDLVVTESGSSAVTVFLGQGNGGFAGGVAYSAGIQPGNVLLADVNGDGKLDAIVADNGSGSVQVLLGNGDGTFGKPVSYPAIANPAALVLGNFDGKGQIDLAVAGPSGMVVLLNDGSGHFAAPLQIALASAPISIAVGDFNSDGHDDLAVGNADGALSILLGDGTGHFNALAPMSVGTASLTSIAAADFNGDGKPDMAVTQANSSTVTVLLGNGDGTFASGVTYKVTNTPGFVTVADMNGDSRIDLITVSPTANTFSILLGNGDGTFQSSLDFVSGHSPVAAVVGDFNGDGHPDLAIINSQDMSIGVPLGRGDGTFEAARAYASDYQSEAVVSGDLNGDGLLDLVVISRCGSDPACGGNGSAGVYLAGIGDTYRLAGTYALGSGPVAAALADLNGDKKLDLVIVNRGDKTATIMLGKGDGTFAAAQTFSLPSYPRSLLIGDFNGDGKSDLAIVSDCGQTTCTQPGTLDVWLGNGDGTFTHSAAYQTGYEPDSIAVGDLLGNGHLDLVVSNSCGEDVSCASPGTAMVFMGDGTGKFTESNEIGIGSAPSAIALSNLSGSGPSGGNLDLVVADRGSNQLAVLASDGTGSFGAPATYSVGSEPSALAIADYNGDGIPDVAVSNYGDATVSVLTGTGSGAALQASNTYTVGTGTAGIAAVSASTVGGSAGGAGLVTADAGSGSQPLASGGVTSLGGGDPGVGTTTVAFTSSAITGTVDSAQTITGTVTETNPVYPAAGSDQYPQGSVAFAIDEGGGVYVPLSDCGTGGVVTLGTTGTTDGVNTASCTTQLLPAGSPTNVVLEYSGDTNYAANNSADQAETISPDAISIGVSSSAGTGSNVNQSVTLTAVVSPSPSPAKPDDNVPFSTATVAFQDGSGNDISGCSAESITNQANGTATAACTTSALTASASATIVASYSSGDPNYTSGSGSLTNYTVAALQPTVTVTPSPVSPSPLNTSVTFTAALTGVTLTPTAPTGTVTFKLNGVTATCVGAANPVTIAAAGTAACAIQNMPVGTTNTVSASYSGDTNFKTASGTSAAYTVTALSPTVIVTPSPVSPSPLNTLITFTAALTNTTLTPVTPTGTITFKLNGSSATCVGGSNPATISAAGTATCAIQNIPAGTSTPVTASYSGDTNFNAESGSSTAYTITALQPAFVITGSPSGTVSAGTTVTYTATMSGVTFTPIAPSGTVLFKLNGTTVTACSAVAVTSEVASCQISSLVAPEDSITATYSGDNNYAPNPNPASFTQNVGQGSSSVDLTSSANPSVVNQSITLTAVVPAPAGQTGAPFPEGTVTFTQGGSTLCGGPQGLSVPTLPLSTTNQPTATCTTVFSTAATDPIIATYNGDQSFVAATSATLSQVVNADGTTTSLASSGAAPVNQSVTFTPTVTPNNSGTAVPQGTVAFTVTGASPTGTCTSGVTLSSAGVAPSCTLTFAAAGTFDVTAKFVPTGSNFLTSTSTELPQTINTASVTVTLSSATNPSTVNQQVSLSTAFGAITGTQPSGNMTFTDTLTGLTLCSNVTVTSGSAATCLATFGSTGAHPVSASFVDTDNNFNNAASNVIIQTVNQTSTTTAVVSATPSSGVNGPVAFTANVAAGVSGPTSPTGTVTFSAALNGNSTVLCAGIPVSTAGSVTTSLCDAPFSEVGSYTVTAAYNGDSNFKASTSPAITQTVGTASTAILISGPTSPSVNQQVAYNVLVIPIITGPGVPTGTVTITDSVTGTQVCSPTALAPNGSDGAAASCAVSFLAAGSHILTATYSGDSNFTGIANKAGIQVAQTATAVSITPSANPTVATKPVTFVAIITPTYTGGAVPTGTVTFTSADGTLDGCTNIVVTPTAGGTASASCIGTFPHTTTFTTGQIEVTAVYSGNTNFTTSSAAPFIETVQDFNLAFAVAPTAVTGGTNISSAKGVYIAQGYSNTADIFNPAAITAVVTSSGGYGDLLKITCSVINTSTSSPVTDPSCSVSSTVSGTTGTSVAVTVSASATAPVGTYSVAITAIDSSIAALSQTTAPALIVNVLGVSAPLSLATGAQGSLTAQFNTASAANGTLTSFSCPEIWDTTKLQMDSNAENALIGCTASSATITGADTSVAITITASGSTQARLNRVNPLQLAGVIGLPFLALAGWFGNKGSGRKSLFKLFLIALFALGIPFASGCGSSFSISSTGTTSSGISPGTYLVQVVATDSSGNNYYSVVQLTVNSVSGQ